MKAFSSMIKQILTHQPPLEAESRRIASSRPADFCAKPKAESGFPDRINMDISHAHSPLSPEPNEIADTHSFLTIEQQFHMHQPNPREVHQTITHTEV